MHVSNSGNGIALLGRRLLDSRDFAAVAGGPRLCKVRVSDVSREAASMGIERAVWPGGAARRPQRISRRALLGALALLGAAARATAQSAKKIRRVVLVSPSAHIAQGVREGFRGLGYVEGETLQVDLRWAEGGQESHDALARELVAEGPDAIVTNGSFAT